MLEMAFSCPGSSVVLLLLLFCWPVAPDQLWGRGVREPLNLSGSPGCPECRIQIDRVVSLGGRIGVDSISLDGTSQVAVSSRGDFAVSTPYEPGRVLLFDSEGTLVGGFGLRGEIAPNESPSGSEVGRKGHKVALRLKVGGFCHGQATQGNRRLMLNWINSMCPISHFPLRGRTPSLIKTHDTAAEVLLEPVDGRHETADTGIFFYRRRLNRGSDVDCWPQTLAPSRDQPIRAAFGGRDALLSDHRGTDGIGPRR